MSLLMEGILHHLYKTLGNLRCFPYQLVEDFCPLVCLSQKPLVRQRGMNGETSLPQGVPQHPKESSGYSTKSKFMTFPQVIIHLVHPFGSKLIRLLPNPIFLMLVPQLSDTNVPLPTSHKQLAKRRPKSMEDESKDINLGRVFQTIQGLPKVGLEQKERLGHQKMT